MVDGEWRAHRPCLRVRLRVCLLRPRRMVGEGQSIARKQKAETWQSRKRARNGSWLPRSARPCGVRVCAHACGEQQMARGLIQQP